MENIIDSAPPELLQVCYQTKAEPQPQTEIQIQEECTENCKKSLLVPEEQMNLLDNQTLFSAAVKTSKLEHVELDRPEIHGVDTAESYSADKRDGFLVSTLEDRMDTYSSHRSDKEKYLLEAGQDEISGTGCESRGDVPTEDTATTCIETLNEDCGYVNSCRGQRNTTENKSVDTNSKDVVCGQSPLTMSTFGPGEKVHAAQLRGATLQGSQGTVMMDSSSLHGSLLTCNSWTCGGNSEHHLLQCDTVAFISLAEDDSAAESQVDLEELGADNDC